MNVRTVWRTGWRTGWLAGWLAGVALFLTMALSPSASAQQPPVYGPQPYAQPYGPPPYGQPAPMQPQGAPYGPTPNAAPPQGGYPYGPQPAVGPAPASTSDGEDSGRTLEFFYARAGVGGAYASLDALSGTGLQLRNLSGVGRALEVGFGARLLIMTIGPRARALVLSNATLWQLGGELALRVPVGRWDPHVGLQGGYTFGQKPREDIECGRPTCDGSGDVGISGGDVAIAGGVDYYVTPMFSLGADLAAMMLLLSRDAAPQPGLPPQPALNDAASMTGFGLKLGAHAGVHF